VKTIYKDFAWNAWADAWIAGSDRTTISADKMRARTEWFAITCIELDAHARAAEACCIAAGYIGAVDEWKTCFLYYASKALSFFIAYLSEEKYEQLRSAEEPR
jgi:hypothetical protein